MSLIFRAVMGWMQYVGGGVPGQRAEQDYLAGAVKPGFIVVDAGGGEGKLAGRLAANSPRLIVVLDRESDLPRRRRQLVVFGFVDAAAGTAHGGLCGSRFRRRPYFVASHSVDAIVSSQVLEHLPLVESVDSSKNAPAYPSREALFGCQLPARISTPPILCESRSSFAAYYRRRLSAVFPFPCAGRG